MENNFNDEKFESFLQEQLQNHKMFPKDSVWREINDKLHGDKRWPALTFASIFIVGLTSFICIHFSTKQSIFFPKPVLLPLITQNLEKLQQKEHRIGTINYPKINTINHKALTSFKNDNTITSLEVKPMATTTVAPLSEEYASGNVELISSNDFIINDKIDPVKSSSIPLQLKHQQSTLGILEQKNVPYLHLSGEDKSTNHESKLNNSELKSIVDNKAVEALHENEFAAKPSLVSSEKKNSKFHIQLYLAPSISYRKLGEDEAVIKGANNGPAGVSQVSDVNDVVRHKPSKGLEGGIGLLYDLAKKVRVKAGFQFNVRQYSIDAYRSNTEISSIALVQNDRIETLNTLVFIRNYNGNSSTELVNRYYQLSMPIGLEWEVAGNKKWSFNIAGSIQPTYIINRNAYLLTTNFKNYTENRDFVRKWNVNTNFEAFVALKVGDVKWQLGPQIRYQPNSTFIARYPIYEHLVDYGIKLGISTNLK